MRVLHIITGLSDGGAEAVLHRLIIHDASDVHHVVSLTGGGKYGPLLRAQGVEVTTLAMPRGHLTWRGLMDLWNTLRSWQPDVVQAWMYHADLMGGVAARLAGLPVVWGIRNTTLEPGLSARSTIAVARLCGWLSRWVPARIVACAQAAAGVHARLGYDAARMVVIPNGYDLSSFVPDPAARQRLRAAWGVPDGIPLLGMVARLDPQKDHANLLAALGCLAQLGEDFLVVLVGSGMTDVNIELAARVRLGGLSARMRLLGPRTDVPAVMTALDVQVLSSAFGEAFPNVLAEAMACGTPCVTTDVGDAAPIVGDTGWVAPPRDPEALANALQQALEAMRDPAAWQARQARCRKRIASHFSIETMVQRYRAVWEEVLDERQRRTN